MISTIENIFLGAFSQLRIFSIAEYFFLSAQLADTSPKTQKFDLVNHVSTLELSDMEHLGQHLGRFRMANPSGLVLEASYSITLVPFFYSLR